MNLNNIIVSERELTCVINCFNQRTTVKWYKIFNWMKRVLLILTISITISATDIIAQGNDSIGQIIYLIGNTSSGSINEVHLELLQKSLLAEKNHYSVILLGDIQKSVQPGTVETAPANIISSIKLTDNGKIFYIPGDEDWANGGNPNIFLPSRGCPGPEVVDLSPHLRLIVINTQWWIASL